jgi:RNA polymerase sigma factor (sigma-70 family)
VGDAVDDYGVSGPLPEEVGGADHGLDGASSVEYVEYVMLYEAEKPRLMRYLIQCGAGHHDAEDAAQRALAALYFRWETVRSPKAWLRKVALRELARASSPAERPVGDHDHLDAPSASAEVESLIEEDAVLSAIRQLPMLQRRVLALHIDQFETSEIAGILQITEAAVRQNLARGRARLKKRLGLSRPGRVAGMARAALEESL